MNYTIYSGLLTSVSNSLHITLMLYLPSAFNIYPPTPLGPGLLAESKDFMILPTRSSSNSTYSCDSMILKSSILVSYGAGKRVFNYSFSSSRDKVGRSVGAKSRSIYYLDFEILF